VARAACCMVDNAFRDASTIVCRSVSVWVVICLQPLNRASVFFSDAFALDFAREPLGQRSSTVLPLLAALSLFWCLWDPTLLEAKRLRAQGRRMRVKGKRRWIVRIFHLPFDLLTD
jgi:hypothetical protein